VISAHHRDEVFEFEARPFAGKHLRAEDECAGGTHAAQVASADDDGEGWEDGFGIELLKLATNFADLRFHRRGLLVLGRTRLQAGADDAVLGGVSRRQWRRRDNVIAARRRAGPVVIRTGCEE